MRRDILASGDELASLRERVSRKPFDAIYDVVRRRCALILESSPVSEARWRSLWQQGRWGAAVEAARTAQGRILDLLIAHRIDPNAAYRDRAIEELRDLISWTTWVDPCHAQAGADLCTAEAAVAAVVGLDWLWEDLGETDRLRVLQAVRHKAIEPYCQAVKHEAPWYNAYNHWNAVVNSGCGLAALALSDENRQALDACQLAQAGLRHFFDALGREGGWDEGIGYWGYALRHLLLFGEACSRLLDDRRIFHARGMDVTGLFPVYFTPNGHPASFGDWPSVPLYGALYLLVRHYGLKEVTWWLDNLGFHGDAAITGWPSAGLAMLFRPADVETPRDPDLKPVKVFNEIGWAAAADRWPRPAFYVAAKAGDLSANHSQRDMNSIQLQVDGEMLLTDPGSAPFSREYFSDARGEFYEVQARAHNTIVVAQRDHRIDAQGSIVEAQSDKAFRWLACDAGNACGENVRFVRHLVMIVQPGTQVGTMLIVLDEILCPVPERVELFWHTGGRMELAGRSMTGAIRGQQANLAFALASTAKFAAETAVREYGQNRRDQVLRVHAGPVSRAIFLSVFAREGVSGKVELKANSSGDVRLRAGLARLLFKSHRRHLQLKAVS